MHVDMRAHATEATARHRGTVADQACSSSRDQHLLHSTSRVQPIKPGGTDRQELRPWQRGPLRVQQAEQQT